MGQGCRNAYMHTKTIRWRRNIGTWTNAQICHCGQERLERKAKKAKKAKRGKREFTLWQDRSPEDWLQYMHEYAEWVIGVQEWSHRQC